MGLSWFYPSTLSCFCKWIRTLDVGWLHGFILILSFELFLQVNKDLRCRLVTWVYLDFIIYFELFLQVNNNDLWRRLITNICKLFGDCFRTIRRTFYNCYLPPPPFHKVRRGEVRGGFGGVRGDRSLTYFYFSPPPSLNVKTLGFGFWRRRGPHLQLAWPLRKNSAGGKIAIYIFGTSPCLQLA